MSKEAFMIMMAPAVFLLCISSISNTWCLQSYEWNEKIFVDSNCALKYISKEEWKLWVDVLSREQIENLSKEKFIDWENKETMKKLITSYIKYSLIRDEDKQKVSEYLNHYNSVETKSKDESFNEKKEEIQKEIERLNKEIEELNKNLNW